LGPRWKESLQHFLEFSRRQEKRFAEDTLGEKERGGCVAGTPFVPFLSEKRLQLAHQPPISLVRAQRKAERATQATKKGGKKKRITASIARRCRVRKKRERDLFRAVGCANPKKGGSFERGREVEEKRKRVRIPCQWRPRTRKIGKGISIRSLIPMGERRQSCITGKEIVPR